MPIDIDRAAWRYILEVLKQWLETAPDPVFTLDEDPTEVEYDAIYDRVRGIFDELNDAHGPES